MACHRPGKFSKKGLSGTCHQPRSLLRTRHCNLSHVSALQQQVKRLCKKELARTWRAGRAAETVGAGRSLSSAGGGRWRLRRRRPIEKTLDQGRARNRGRSPASLSARVSPGLQPALALGPQSVRAFRRHPLSGHTSIYIPHAAAPPFPSLELSIHHPLAKAKGLAPDSRARLVSCLVLFLPAAHCCLPRMKVH
jgi:hypothetical protein